MAKTLKIKVCGMRDSDNIEAVLKASPDYIGFIFYPKSARYVGENPHTSIFKMVPSSVQKVGVFVNEDRDQVVDICRKYGLEVAQLHGNESPEYCRFIQKQGVEVFKAFSVYNDFDFQLLEDYVPAIDYFLFDTKGKLPGGTGLKFNWKILGEYQFDVPFFLSGGIGPDDVAAIKKLKNEQLFALDINSGFENEPGLKDADKVYDFIESIKGRKSH